MKENKSLVFKKYGVNNEEELYELLLKDNITNVEKKDENDDTTKDKSISTKILNKNQDLKELINIFRISILEIMILIGLGFLSSFSMLLFGNEFILIGMLFIIFLILFFIIKDISYLFLLPIPIILSFKIDSEYFLIYILLYLIVYLSLFYLKNNSSLYLSILLISSWVFMFRNFDFNNYVFLVSIITCIMYLLIFLYTWFKLNKYFIASSFYILSIISMNQFIMHLDIESNHIVHFILSIILFVLTMYTLIKDKNVNIENNFFKIFREYNLVVIIIAILINSYISIENLIDNQYIGMFIVILIISLYLFIQRKNEWLLYQFSVFNLIIMLPFYLTIAFDLNDINIISTIISLIIFFSIYSYQKKINMKVEYYMVYTFIFTIYFLIKIIMVDLNEFNLLIRLFLLFIFGIIFIGFAIYKSIKMQLEKKKQKDQKEKNT